MNAPAWFVCPRANPQAKTRLFIFPYAGGGPAAFSKWSADGTEVQIAHYPGRGSRSNEPQLEGMEGAVERLSQAIQPLLDKPFAFFGHSMGGMIAFELARHLRQDNRPQPYILFVSACGAPHIPDPNPPIHKLPDAEFLVELEKLNGIPLEILQYREILDLLLPTLHADLKLMATYKFNPDTPPLDCRIVAFGGLDDARVNRQRLEGWAVQTTAAFNVEYFSGDHFFINTARDSLIEAIATEL